MTSAWPDWLVVRVPASGPGPEVDMTLRRHRLHTVCEAAQCPNIWECYHSRTATFLILGDACTRRCGFCAVGHGPTAPVDQHEPLRLAQAALALGLKHVVITSVTRDDLSDGGAGQFAACVRAVRATVPCAKVEVLVPDFGGDRTAVDTVLRVAPDVFNHNLETVPRLYSTVRPQAGYARSLAVLAQAAAAGATVKSGLMLGLGERPAEVRQALRDLREAGCHLVTMGQYLRPSPAHLPVRRFVPPAEFDRLKAAALELGFRGVVSAPLVRSSYRAEQMAAHS